MKFTHEGRIITIQSDKDVVTSSESVLQISHSEDDLHLTGFAFDEVQVISLEDDDRDMVPMSFDQYNSTLVLSMIKASPICLAWDWVAANKGCMSLLSQLITTYHMDWVTLLLRMMHDTWRGCAGIG